jgi:hypothetical protein
MSDMREYVLRVRPSTGGGFAATFRQLCGTSHPEVRAVLGAVATGHGANEAAAMVAAIANARIVDVPEVRRVD